MSKYDHIVVIEENKLLNTVIGNKDIPYMNYLAERCIIFTNTHFSSRPIQSDYIVLFSVQLHGINNNQINSKITALILYPELRYINKTFVILKNSISSLFFSE